MKIALVDTVDLTANSVDSSDSEIVCLGEDKVWTNERPSEATISSYKDSPSLSDEENSTIFTDEPHSDARYAYAAVFCMRGLYMCKLLVQLCLQHCRSGKNEYPCDGTRTVDMDTSGDEECPATSNFTQSNTRWAMLCMPRVSVYKMLCLL